MHIYVYIHEFMRVNDTGKLKEMQKYINLISALKSGIRL